MKDSGVEWIDKIPIDWEAKPLKYVCLFRKGLPITKADLIDDGVPVVSYGQIHAKDNTGTHLHEGLVRYVDEHWLVTNRSAIARRNDFLFADTSEDYDGLGNCVFVDSERTLFAGYHTIIGHPHDFCCPKYLAYLFNTDCWRRQIREKASGVKVFSVTQSILRRTSVILPPAEERQRIVDYLDERCAAIDEVRRTIEDEIEALRRLRKATVHKAVTKGLDDSALMKDSGVEWIGIIPETWTVSRLGYECYIRARLGWRGLKADEYVDEGFAFISAFNIQKGKLVWEPLNYITEERYDESPEIKIRCGDVLLVKDGAGVGKSARVDELPMGGTSPNSSIGVLTPYGRLDYRYLHYYLQSKSFDTFVSLLYNGMGVPHLTQEITRSIKLPIPSLTEQERIADYLDERCASIDSVIDTRTKQLERLDDYRKALIFAYVTGKREVPTS